MFACLLFAATIVANIELPTTNTIESQELQTIVTLLTQEEPTTETIEDEQTIIAVNEEIKVIEEKLITITNNIQPSMLAYKHWTGTYNPDAFTVFINDTEVAQGTEIKIPAANSTINVKFDYSFVNGMRKGSKTVSYKLNDDITQANITFSWKDDNKILIDNGTAVAT